MTCSIVASSFQIKWNFTIMRHCNNRFLSITNNKYFGNVLMWLYHLYKTRYKQIKQHTFDIIQIFFRNSDLSPPSHFLYLFFCHLYLLKDTLLCVIYLLFFILSLFFFLPFSPLFVFHTLFFLNAMTKVNFNDFNVRNNGLIKKFHLHL